ncbi:MAG: histidinol dehydrogenase, partial [Deltaproteobacteria bacterium]|nr:histidinol dehydrogenase [Deltaproteobacteria bacterium]
NTQKRAMDVANMIAPEHLELAVRKPQEYLKFVRHAGAVFLGAFTPEVLGDYVAGPDHVLPTMGSARFSSGLGVYDFMKRTTLLEVRENGFLRLAQHAGVIGRVEGLEAHTLATRI